MEAKSQKNNSEWLLGSTPPLPRTHLYVISLYSTVLKEPLESSKQGDRNPETSVRIEARMSGLK